MCSEMFGCDGEPSKLMGTLTFGMPIDGNPSIEYGEYTLCEVCYRDCLSHMLSFIPKSVRKRREIQKQLKKIPTGLK